MVYNLLLTNFPRSFLKSQTLETGLSDFRKLTLTVLKLNYKKQKPLVVTYRDYKNFSNESFRTELSSAMKRYSNIYFADFHSKFLYLLGKQRKYCVKLLLQKERQYFENLNLSSIADSKLFWKKLFPLFTEKSGSKNNKITLVEGGKVLTDGAKIVETFNSFFGNVVNTANIENVNVSFVIRELKLIVYCAQ